MNRILHISFLTKRLLTFIIIILMTGYSFAAGTQVKIIKCYPNPATSVVNFEFQNGGDKNAILQIYSFSGKKMKDVSLASGKATVILDNDYYRGIYVYRLTDKNGRIIETGKFQVVK